MVTHNYVLVETVALVQRRHGMSAVRAIVDDVVPVMRVVWVGEGEHLASTAALLAGASRAVSLVDRVSFHMMRRLGIASAFAFDPDFVKQGFAVVPERPL